MKVADVRYLAFNGHSGRTCECLLLGVERTLDGGASMSANDPKRTLSDQLCCDAQQFRFDMVGWRRQA